MSSSPLLRFEKAGFDVLMAPGEDYNGVNVSRCIDVLKDGKPGMRIIVTEIGPADPSVAHTFTLKRHERQRAFTPEVR